MLCEAARAFLAGDVTLLPGALTANEVDALVALLVDRADSTRLSRLAESKEKVRSALNRATRKRGGSVATASDDTFLYVWNEKS